MPYIKPGPGQCWCPCCEKLFTPAGRAQTFCSVPACLARRPAWRAQIEAAKAAEVEAKRPKAGCQDCGKTAGHTGTCMTARLAKPCYICGRMMTRGASGPDAPTREHLASQQYLKINGTTGVHLPANVVLAHARCNNWKSNRLPRDIVLYQPPWGVKPGVAKVIARELPAPTLTKVTKPVSVRTVAKHFNSDGTPKSATRA